MPREEIVEREEDAPSQQPPQDSPNLPPPPAPPEEEEMPQVSGFSWSQGGNDGCLRPRELFPTPTSFISEEGRVYSPLELPPPPLGVGKLPHLNFCQYFFQSPLKFMTDCLPLLGLKPKQMLPTFDYVSWFYIYHVKFGHPLISLQY